MNTFISETELRKLWKLSEVGWFLNRLMVWLCCRCGTRVVPWEVPASCRDTCYLQWGSDGFSDHPGTIVWPQPGCICLKEWTLPLSLTSHYLLSLLFPLPLPQSSTFTMLLCEFRTTAYRFSSVLKAQILITLNLVLASHMGFEATLRTSCWFSSLHQSQRLWCIWV